MIIFSKFTWEWMLQQTCFILPTFVSQIQNLFRDLPDWTVIKIILKSFSTNTCIQTLQYVLGGLVWHFLEKCRKMFCCSGVSLICKAVNFRKAHLCRLKFPVFTMTSITCWMPTLHTRCCAKDDDEILRILELCL